MNPEVNRRKAAMVLHAIESSLGNYVISKEKDTGQISEKLVEDIVKRELARNNIINNSSVKDIVEATYLDEIFQIALEVSVDTSLYCFMQSLKEFFVVYDIYEIRNVISHPNRKFIDSYWYKVAAIASDPIIDILGISEVKKALISAESGEIVDPPDEWFLQAVWNVPNNIPKQFEHAITGLVGRKKEAEALLNNLENPRVNTIAIVAPGGIGKTALALDLISQKMSTPDTKKWCDACIFVSMKTEKLTPDGLKNLDAFETIEEIKEQITVEAGNIFGKEFSSFESLKEGLREEKLLLFIDNLETLLIDSERDFQEFNISLPASWRVLVTSRIAISNASIITLNSLNEKSATHMARVYSGRRGGAIQEQQVYENIARNCFCNPLAIRLTVDLYLSGKEIPASVEVVNKEIAGFSYNNLIENVSEVSIKILEALFVSESSSRIELCDILGLSREETALGVSELSNTSLIVRRIQDNDEVFMLSSSVRELLLTNPKNISVRSEIQAIINKRKILALEIDAKQVRQNLPPYHIDFIPSDVNENLKILLTELNNALGNKFSLKNEKAIILYKKFKEVCYLYDDSPLFHRGYARILNSLNAKSDAINHLKKAISLSEGDPNNKVLLARIYHENSDFEHSELIYEELMDEGWGVQKEDNKKLAYFVTSGYFLSLLFGHKYEVILDVTKEWKEHPNFRGLIGAFRASAWKRKCEDVVNTDSDATVKYLLSAIRILDDVFKNDGYIKSACLQAKSIFNEIAFCLGKQVYCSKESFATESLVFINEHLHRTLEYTNYNEDDFAYRLIERLAKVDLSNNPFKSKQIGYKCSGGVDGIDISEIKKEGMVEASIVRVPKGRNNGPNTFMFAVDNGRVEYFIHYDQLVNGGWPEWSGLSVGDAVVLKPNATSEANGKSSTVSEVHLIA